MNKWGFIPRSSWGSGSGKLLRGTIKGKEKFWLNQLDRILAAGRLGWSDTNWGGGWFKKFDQISKTIRYQEWRILLSWLSRIFAEIGQCKNGQGSFNGQCLVEKNLTKVWSRRISCQQDPLLIVLLWVCNKGFSQTTFSSEFPLGKKKSLANPLR